MARVLCHFLWEFSQKTNKYKRVYTEWRKGPLTLESMLNGLASSEFCAICIYELCSHLWTNTVTNRGTSF